MDISVTTASAPIEHFAFYEKDTSAPCEDTSAPNKKTLRSFAKYTLALTTPAASTPALTTSTPSHLHEYNRYVYYLFYFKLKFWTIIDCLADEYQN